MQQEYYDPWSNTKTKNGLDADLVIGDAEVYSPGGRGSGDADGV